MSFVPSYLLTKSYLPLTVTYVTIKRAKISYLQVKCSRHRPGVAHRVGRGTTLLFHDRDTRRGWMVNSTLRPHFTPRKTPGTHLQEAGWDPGPVWTGEKSRPHRDSILDRPPRSKSLYRLSYPAYDIVFTYNININILLYRHVYFRCVFLSHDLKDKIIFLPSSRFLWRIFEAVKRLVKVILASWEFYSLPFFHPKRLLVQQTRILWHAFLGTLVLIWRFSSSLSAFTFVARLSHERKRALFICSSCEISRTVRIFMKFRIRKFYEKFSSDSTFR